MVFDVEVLTRTVSPTRPAPAFTIVVADAPVVLEAAHRLRRRVFVEEQGLFVGDDHDVTDSDPHCLTLLAVAPDGTPLGTVRLAPATLDDDPVPAELGWWSGSRLAVAPEARTHRLGVGSALVRAACAHAEDRGVLRFDAHVQAQNAVLFDRLGWDRITDVSVHGQPHVLMSWPVDRIQRLVDRTKSVLGGLLAPLRDTPYGLGGPGFVGDDGAPVPGSDLIAATDAIIPSMVERDPEWAGWCSVLVNLNDLAAMGASPVALLDSFGARDASFATRIVNGITRASRAWDVPVIGGHSQLGVPASLSVTALGRTDHPVAAGGARPGDGLTLTADLGGDWRPGYHGLQWDSTSQRSTADLQAMGGVVGRTRPAAAKDVSMAGLVGTTGMLAEASGCGAVIDVADVPRPTHARTGDWFTCFPGFAMITADRPGRAPAPAGPAVSARCGELVTTPGVRLRWPDGRLTSATHPHVTGMGPA